MEFRRDINGLRAIAVLAVIVFHFNADWLPGGFAGVDVFFVISGYLMTSIIYRGLEKEQFSLIKFYLARGRRIIPALLPPCLLLLVVGWFYLMPTTYMALAKHVAASIGFVSNIVYWTEAGYFAPGAHEKWLLHTWSLSVEWQFYMVYPVVLMLLRRWLGLAWLRYCVAIGTLLSLALSAYASTRFTEAAFFLLPTRAWEMMAGGLVMLFPVSLTPRVRQLTELGGLLIILVSYICFSESNVWPGTLAALPVLGASLLLIANRQTSWATNNPFSQWLGNISYSLYIWHWPIVVGLTYLGLLSQLRYQLLGIAASMLMAHLSYTWVEQKMRVRTTPVWTWRWLGTATALCACGFAIFHLQGVVSPLRSVSVSEQARFIAEYDWKYRHLGNVHWIEKCNMFSVYQRTHTLHTDPVCTEKKGPGGVFLWGDSHAEALSYGLRAALPKGLPFYQATSAGCRPGQQEEVKLKGDARVACDYSNRFAWQKIADLKPDIVIMAQQKIHQQTDWQALSTRLAALGVRQVVLVGPVPQWQPSLPSVVATRHWREPGNYILDAALDPTILRTNDVMQTLAGRGGYTYVSVIDQLCQKMRCLARIPPGDALLLVDYGHLSAEGSEYVVRHVVMPRLQLEPPGALQSAN